MSLIPEMEKDLWSQLEIAIQDPEEFTKLTELVEDPIFAAKIRASVLEEQIIKKYGEEKGNEILGDIESISTLQGFYKSLDGKIKSVELSYLNLPPTSIRLSIEKEVLEKLPKKTLEKIAQMKEVESSITEKMDIFTYLREVQGVKSDDLPLLIEYGNCWRIYRGTLNKLIEDTRKELSGIYRSGLLEALGIIDSINPTPGFPTKSLMYEIMNHEMFKKIKKAEEKGDSSTFTATYAHNSWLERFNKEEMKILANIVKEYQEKGFIDPTFSESHKDLFDRFYELGLLKLATKSGEPVYQVDEEVLYNSTILVWNTTSINPKDIEYLSDLRKLKNPSNVVS